MAITVEHEIDPALVGALSYATGRQQYRRRQSEEERALFQRNQQQLLDQASQRDAELARERMIRERPERQEALRAKRNAYLPRARWGGNPGTDLADLAMNRDKIRGGIVSTLLEGRQRQDAELQDHLAARQHQLDRFEFDWGADSAVAVEDQIKEIQKNLSKQQHKLTPEGKRLYGELTGKLRSIQKFRANIRPHDYTKVLGQWLEEYNKAGIEDFIQEPPTPQQMWEKNAFKLDDRNAFVVDPSTGKGTILEIKHPETPEEREHALPMQQREIEKIDWQVYKTKMDAWKATAGTPPDISQFITQTKNEDGSARSEINYEAYAQAMAAYQVREDQRMQQMPQPPFPAVQDRHAGLMGAPGAPLPAKQPRFPATGQEASGEPQPAIAPQSAPISDNVSQITQPELEGFNSMHEAAAALRGQRAPSSERIELYRTLGVELSAEGYPVLKTEEQADEFYDVWLRPGDLFIGPDGKLRRKSPDPTGSNLPPQPQESTPRVLLPSTTSEPVAVASAEDLRAKVQSGAIPLGGKYVVNGVVFTRTK